MKSWSTQSSPFSRRLISLRATSGKRVTKRKSASTGFARLRASELITSNFKALIIHNRFCLPHRHDCLGIAELGRHRQRGRRRVAPSDEHRGGTSATEFLVTDSSFFPERFLRRNASRFLPASEANMRRQNGIQCYYQSRRGT
ncbi:hypothetical protein SDC9_184067 [bioreactor metagenome]|uniref:Uncharacterized protein n=1 Tax=bioreactor metagenome TaxID=1076179 RepID=A0A645HBZ9_9ZZZZ